MLKWCIFRVRQTIEHVQAMKQRIAALESALAQSTLDNRMLSATLAVAGEELGIDLKKTFAPRSSNRSQERE